MTAQKQETRFDRQNKKTPVIGTRVEAVEKEALIHAAEDLKTNTSPLIKNIIREWLIREGYLTIDGRLLK